MLEDAHELKRQGVDVVVGFVEAHGRADTLAQIRDLEQVPLRQIEYRGVTLREMDLDAILARRPAIAVVDELAHTNAPGSTHQKRYEDVLALLDAGDQRHHRREHPAHRVAERRDRVDDRRARARDGARLGAEARRRSRERGRVGRDAAHAARQGKIYDAAKIEQALTNFFRKGNLTALRELALRQLASDQAGKAQAYRRARGARAAGHSRKGDGGDGLARQRENAAARRLAHRRAAGDRLVCGLRRDAEGGAGPHQAGGSRRAGGQHPLRAAARREGGQAEGLARRRPARRVREARGHHARRSSASRRGRGGTC